MGSRGRNGKPNYIKKTRKILCLLENKFIIESLGKVTCISAAAGYLLHLVAYQSGALDSFLKQRSRYKF
jgi:hypothetical protein